MASSSNSPPDMAEWLRVALIQTVIDAQVAWRGRPSMDAPEEDNAWYQVKLGFQHLVGESDGVDLVLLPELAVPRRRVVDLKRLAAESGAVVMGGLDYHIDAQKRLIRNEGIVIVPRSWPEKKRARVTRTFNFGKTYAAPKEKVGFSRLQTPLSFVPDTTAWLFETGRFGRIGVCICYDFMDIERFMMYRTRVHHLIALAHNRDIRSFYSIAESLARTVFCNVIVCNTGYFGGSLAISPYYEPHMRTIYRHEGPQLFGVQAVSLPVAMLDEAQRGIQDNLPNGGEGIRRLFKSRPPGFEERFRMRARHVRLAGN